MRWPGVVIERRFGPRAVRSLPFGTLGRLAGLLVAWRLAILLFSHLSMLWSTLPPCWGGAGILGYSACWDSAHYLQIVRHGYDYVPGTGGSVAFFPLYPLLIRASDCFLPHGDVLAGLVVGHMALAAAVVYLYRLVRLDFGERVAWRTLWFLLIFPGAFFFSALYTESLALLGLTGAFYHARRGQWLRAGLFGASMSATKLIGLLLPIPLGVELLAQRALSWRRPRPLLALALAPLGALAYFAYLQAQFGNALAYFEAQRVGWQRPAFSVAPGLVLSVRWLLGGDPGMLDPFYPPTMVVWPVFFLLLDALSLLLFAVAGVVLWRRVRASYGALVLSSVAVLALSGLPQSLNRYVAILFPAFILLGLVKSKPIRYALSLASLVGLGLLTHWFLHARWAG